MGPGNAAVWRGAGELLMGVESSAARPSRRRGSMGAGHMTAVLAPTALFRDRDLFVHDGSKLRRFRVSAPVQAVLFLALLALVAWASYATARLVARPLGSGSLSAATEARAR